MLRERSVHISAHLSLRFSCLDIGCPWLNSAPSSTSENSTCGIIVGGQVGSNYSLALSQWVNTCILILTVFAEPLKIPRHLSRQLLLPLNCWDHCKVLWLPCVGHLYFIHSSMSNSMYQICEYLVPNVELNGFRNVISYNHRHSGCRQTHLTYAVAAAVLCWSRTCEKADVSHLFTFPVTPDLQYSRRQTQPTWASHKPQKSKESNDLNVHLVTSSSYSLKTT